MKKVFKYPLSPGFCRVALPVGSTVLDVAQQANGIFLWAEVPGETGSLGADRDSLRNACFEDRIFYVVPTGIEYPEDGRRFIKTVHFRENGLHFVFHVFEKGGAS